MPTTSSEDKLAALRKHNALNLRSQAVTDELFASHPFFDPHDLVQVKYEMLRCGQTEGKSVTQVAASFGFSRQSFYEARAAWRKSGLAGLLPQRRGPRRAHKLSEEVVEFIERALDEDSSLRSRDLVQRVKDKFGLSLHPRSIERGLVRRLQKGAPRAQP